MEKSQILKVFIPGLALALVILIVGLLVGLKSEPPVATKSSGIGGVPIPNVPPNPNQTSDSNAEGTTLQVPSVAAAEWKAYGSDGLKIWDVKEGSGDEAPAGSTVTIHYTGWFTTGGIFDSSVQKGGPPATFELGRLIKAWQIGIPKMKPGGIRRLLVPPELGYGAGGSPPKIPGGATLVFEVKLISFN